MRIPKEYVPSTAENYAHSDLWKQSMLRVHTKKEHIHSREAHKRMDRCVWDSVEAAPVNLLSPWGDRGINK